MGKDTGENIKMEAWKEIAQTCKTEALTQLSAFIFTGMTETSEVIPGVILTWPFVMITCTPVKSPVSLKG